MSGAPKSLALLIEKINKEEYDPIVLLIGRGEVSEYYKEKSIDTIISHGIIPFHGSTVSGMTFKLMIRNILGVIPTYIKTKMIINQLKPDLVHLNSTCLFVVAKAIKDYSKDIPVTVHVREPILSNFAGKILKYFNNKYTDGYVSIDEYDLSLMNTKKKSLVVNNFSDLDCEMLDSNNMNIYDNKKEALRFLYLGRIRPSNGILELVNMINSCFKNDHRCKFIICGFSSDKTQYEKKVLDEIGDTKNIEVKLFVSDIADIIMNSDIIISPFTEPHFSRAVVEGAVLGKPALITDVGAQNELIQDGITGFKYSVNNNNEFREKVELFLNDRSLVNDMGMKARELSKIKFDSDKNSKLTFDFLRSYFDK